VVAWAEAGDGWVVSRGWQAIGLGRPRPCKGNVRARLGRMGIQQSILRNHPNLSNPRVGGSNPPGRDEPPDFVPNSSSPPAPTLVAKEGLPYFLI